MERNVTLCVVRDILEENRKMSKEGGIGFCGLLTVLFIGLKLTHYIDWSWWWILSPIIAPLIIVLAIIVGIVIAGIIHEVLY